MDYKIQIAQYQEQYAKDLAEIYYNTIHLINIKDYTKEQLYAWAPRSLLNPKNWIKKWEKTLPYVALIDNKPVGFIEFESNGHIDCFYVHHKYQNIGVGSALIDMVDKRARENLLPKIYAEVSITAKSFFEKKGFKVVKQQTICKGVEIINFIMEKNYS